MFVEYVGAAFIALGMISMALLLAGTVTDYWILTSVNNTHNGVWRACELNQCDFFPISTIDDFWLWVRVAMSVAAAFLFIALCANIGVMCHTDVSNQKNACRVSIACYILSGILTVAAILMPPVNWTINEAPSGSYDYGYSYWLSVAAGLTVFLTGSIFGCAAHAWLHDPGAIPEFHTYTRRAHRPVYPRPARHSTWGDISLYPMKDYSKDYKKDRNRSRDYDDYDNSRGHNNPYSESYERRDYTRDYR